MNPSEIETRPADAAPSEPENAVPETPSAPETPSLAEALPVLERKLHGFGAPDALMVGVETRSSSPVRLLRDRSYQSNIRGLYPCGEGAGYAGGITSAAMDGIKVAEAIAAKYKPM